MYIDKSRQADIYYLTKALKDPTVSKANKAKAYKSLCRIRRELKNPVLSNLRRRLMNAGDAGDKNGQWKIAMQIKDYLKEERLEKDTY